MQIYTKNIESAYQLFHQGALALQKVEQQGMCIDVAYIEKQNNKINRKIKRLEQFIYDSQFFKEWQHFQKGKFVNIYSGQQLSKYLYKGIGIKPKKYTKTEQGSTDVEALSYLNIPEINSLLQIKKLKKIRDTYLEGFLREQVNGIIHPFFNLHLVRTFRSSANAPNFQNIPKREEKVMKIVRGAIRPRKGNQILELDNSMLEVRIAACYHKDPTMIKYIETGHDMHKDITMQIFSLHSFDPELHKKLRSATKNGFVFPQFYGSYYKNCAENLAQDWCKLSDSRWKSGQGIQVGTENISDILIRSGIKGYGNIEKNRTTGFIKHIQEIETDFWENRFPIFNRWKETWWNAYKKDGYFESKTGFIFQGVMSRNDATNYPIQGAAFHVLLWTLIRAVNIFEKLGMQTKVIGQVHDSIVFDVYPPELKKVIRIMKRIMEIDIVNEWKWIIVPMKIEAELCPINASWAEKQEYKI